MILHVTYETDNGVIKKTFKHHYPDKLLEAARNCDAYKKCHTVTFELEEVNEHGDKCGEC